MKRRVKVFQHEYDKESGKWERKHIGAGLFHQFGCDYEDCGEDGPANFSTAIVEMPDGSVKNHPVHLIEFLYPFEDK